MTVVPTTRRFEGFARGSVTWLHRAVPPRLADLIAQGIGKCLAKPVRKGRNLDDGGLPGRFAGVLCKATGAASRITGEIEDDAALSDTEAWRDRYEIVH